MAVSFVGSTKVAEYIFEESSRHQKRVATFGGWKCSKFGEGHMFGPDTDTVRFSE